MDNLVCLTGCLFSEKSLSINYHLMLLLKCLLSGGKYKMTVYSYDANPVLTEKELLNELGCPELYGKVMFACVATLAPRIWADKLAKADVLLCQHYSFSEILEEAKARRPELRIVSWIHSIVQEEYLSGTINSINDAYPLIRQQNRQVSCSDICIFDSEYDYSLGRMDFRAIKRAGVIHPVTEMERFREKRRKADQAIFRKGNLDPTKVELLFIGRWDYRKGLDSLIPCSFRMFMEHGVKTVLLTDGREEYVFSEQAVRRQFRSLLRSGGIRFEDWKTEKQEYGKYLCGEKRRIAVLPSYYDPFNMAAYDCAVLNIPMVISNRCGICEILPSQKSIAVCNPYDVEDVYQKIYSMCQLAVEPFPEYTLEYRLPQFYQDIKAVFQGNGGPHSEKAVCG